jgi:class 3 adenylate cyclase/tetratricopeptide (TPR) repeat protein
VAICASCGHQADAEFKFCPECGTPAGEPEAREVRKTVTVLFCDVTGSTALGESVDPEALRSLLVRYFERMKAIVESHGGTVEKFIGDAVMAVFGVPLVHEDDALRACRAAVEMRDAFPELGITGRIGLTTGAVVAGTDERLATGDAVNVAARLEQAAQPGEVLIGDPTHALVKGAVDVEPVGPLELKGKTERVPAFRLLAVTGERTRRFATPMVGRERELRSLRDALSRAVHDRSCQLFTVLGSAGVGKSRLAAEFLVDADVRVVRGRCLSYGEGITYWPVVEVLKQLDTLPADEDAAAPLRSLLGESDSGTTTDEIAWGFRRLLEEASEREPLACVFDDLQWAEPTFLALVESVAELSRDAPILILCMARPELLELRPSWGGGMWNATTVLLEPLNAGETDRLLAHLGGAEPQLATRIMAAAEGNPLFVEEMLALVRDSADGRVDVPPTIRALLAARLDQLDPAERGVLERGSVEGEIFHRGAVEALADGEPQADRLLALVRKQLVRPDRPQLPREDGYRFRHLLIRDAAYEGLPKSVRADLHRRFAAWLEIHGRALVELEEVVGYHLEQAARCLADLGRPDAELTREAAGRLAAAGRRARWRQDRRAAQSLLRRAIALSEHPDVHVVVDLAQSLDDDDTRGAVALLDEAADRADADGDETGSALARTVAAALRVVTVEGSADEQERLAKAALPMLEAAGDHAGLAEVWASLAVGVYNFRGHLAKMEDASEMAMRHAALAGQQQTFLWTLPVAIVHGPRPATDALEKIEAVYAHPWTDLHRATLLAMCDRVTEARMLVASAEDRLGELGLEGGHAHMMIAHVERILGNDERAAERFGRAADHAVEHGQTGFYASYVLDRGRSLVALGRYEEAEPLGLQGRELAGEDPYWRQLAALLASRRGDDAEAVRLGREAVGFAQETDSPWAQGDAFSDLAEVLEAAGLRDEAAAALGEALGCYERKQILPFARRARERLAALQPAQTS